MYVDNVLSEQYKWLLHQNVCPFDAFYAVQRCWNCIKMGRGRNNSLNQYRDTILQITYHLLVLTTHLLQVSFTTVFIQPATISIFLSNFCTNVYFQLVDHVSYLTHILNPHYPFMSIYHLLFVCPIPVLYITP